MKWTVDVWILQGDSNEDFYKTQCVHELAEIKKTIRRNKKRDKRGSLVIAVPISATLAAKVDCMQ